MAGSDLSPGRREVPYVKRYRDYWLSEQSAAWLYRALADAADQETAATLSLLAEAEERHASHWAKLLAQAGAGEPTFPGPPRRDHLRRNDRGKEA